MRLALILIAAWIVVSVPAGLFVGAFIRVGHGPDPTGENINEGTGQ